MFFVGEFSATSDGSSPNTSAANTPDSGDALDESTDSGLSSGIFHPHSTNGTCKETIILSEFIHADRIAGTSGAASSLEKKSVRELAASLNKTDPDGKKKTEPGLFVS